jgi:hypothetical protein
VDVSNEADQEVELADLEEQPELEIAAGPPEVVINEPQPPEEPNAAANIITEEIIVIIPLPVEEEPQMVDIILPNITINDYDYRLPEAGEKPT